MFILVFLKFVQIQYIPVSTIKRKRTHFEHFPVSYFKEDYIRCQILGLSKKKLFEELGKVLVIFCPALV